MTITIVGLGPGNPDQITLEAWRTLERATTVLLWSEQHIPVAALPAGPRYRLLEAEIEASDDWVAAVAAAVLRHEEVVFAVPGSPSVLDDVVAVIRREARERDREVRLVPGMSFLEPVMARLQLEGEQGLQLCSAPAVAAMHHPPLQPDVPALLPALDSQAVAKRVQAVLLNQYPPDHEVTLVHAAGTDRETVESLPLAKLAQSEAIGATTTLYVPPLALPYASFERLQETMAHLRSPEGCPWDREQDHMTLRPYLLEEAYEVLDALDRGDLQALQEELGDLLLQVVFHVQVAVDQGEFRMADVIHHINAKLIHRHPHVWGDVNVNDSGDVARNWEAIKKQERKDNGKGKESLLDGVSKALPALAQAYNYQVRAARVGFDWDRIEPVIDKIREEIDEIQAAADPEERQKEIGDLLFALVNWTRWMGVEPETALREANQRFYRRFHYIERAAEQAGRSLAEMTLAEMDTLWDEAKRQGL
ncbi:MAG: nucleoside triphosphate pyrophosphohydrolase [Anaerolineae bacterium]